MMLQSKTSFSIIAEFLYAMVNQIFFIVYSKLLTATRKDVLQILVTYHRVKLVSFELPTN